MYASAENRRAADGRNGRFRAHKVLKCAGAVRKEDMNGEEKKRGRKKGEEKERKKTDRNNEQRFVRLRQHRCAAARSLSNYRCPSFSGPEKQTLSGVREFYTRQCY